MINDLSLYNKTDKNGISVICLNACCNMQHTPSDYLYGKIVESLSTNEMPEECEKLAEQLSRSYKPIVIPSRDELLQDLHKIDNRLTLSELPILALNETMCHCCT